MILIVFFVLTACTKPTLEDADEAFENKNYS